MHSTHRKQPRGRLLPAALLCVLAVVPLALSTMAPASASPAVGAAPPTVVAAATPQCQSPGTAKHCLIVQWTHGPGALSPAQRARVAQINARATARPAAGQAAAASDVSDPVTPPLECNFFTGAVDSTPDRLTSCGEGTATVTDVNRQTGQPIGTYSFETIQWLTLFAGDPFWIHDYTVITLSGTGSLAGGFTMAVSSLCGLAPLCDSFSTAAPDPQVIQVADFTAYGFEWQESDGGPAATQNGQSDDMFGRIGVVLDGTSNDPDGSGFRAQDTGGGDPHQGIVTMFARCDSIIEPPDTEDGDDGSGNPEPPRGCVDNVNIPTLDLLIAQSGASAAMIQWGQGNLSAHWGLQGSGDPLQYLASSATARANRNLVCDDGTFVNQGAAIGGDDGGSDSCDEYPFAHSYQSAGKSGITGDQCAQVTAVEVDPAARNGVLEHDWNAVQPVGTFSASAPCVRGHIPDRLNFSAGGVFGAFVRANRLADLDKFWVSVT